MWGLNDIAFRKNPMLDLFDFLLVVQVCYEPLVIRHCGAVIQRLMVGISSNLETIQRRTESACYRE